MIDTLLISPKFFSYENIICDAFLRQGFRPKWINCRASEKVIYKAFLKFFPTFTRFLSEPYFKHKIKNIDAPDSVTKVLIIKGDCISIKTIKYLKDYFKNAEFIFYNWDNFKNAKGSEKLIPFFDRSYTFDQDDSIRFDITYRPLFCSFDKPSQSVADMRKTEISFVGSLHSDRYIVLRNLIRLNKNMKFNVYIYSGSVFLNLINRMVQWYWPRRNDGIVTSTKKIPYSEFLRIKEKSLAIIDVEHERQSGLTMRTIETLLSGGKLITTNTTVLTSDLYDESRVVVVPRSGNRIEDDWLYKKAKCISPEVRLYYSVDGWLTELLGLRKE